MITPLIPDWPAPIQVKAVITTRKGGISRAPYASLNLATHVGDAPAAVKENRERLISACGLPGGPFWMNQVHGSRVADSATDSPGCEADAVFSDRPGAVCAVLTADCLPLLIADRSGTRVCAVHAGWRGLVGGVIESAVSRMGVTPAELLVWMGPAIGPESFEVGAEVRQAFTDACMDDSAAFVSHKDGRWLADIYHLARLRLARLGVGYIGGGGYCTVRQADLFYSYRREGVTGRMASMIWLESP
ncbi:MAG: peptidoglycan editing factor PgeF [Candidatus Thiodiazotropha sp. (ex Monitilora ramsayi)]|nr:peptidoglycan editing factor PgeF [Candidatus Thiodiazotropha sp. (ex Monitilora ramsayi)]